MFTATQQPTLLQKAMFANNNNNDNGNLSDNQARSSYGSVDNAAFDYSPAAEGGQSCQGAQWETNVDEALISNDTSRLFGKASGRSAVTIDREQNPPQRPGSLLSTQKLAEEMSGSSLVSGKLSRRERLLGVLSIAFILASVVLATILAVQKADFKSLLAQQERQRQQQYAAEISSSPGFKAAAATLAQAIDFSVDPCDDFFDYVCGNWIRINPIPEGRSSYGSFAKLRDQVAHDMAKILNETATNSTNEVRPGAVTKLKWSYDACLNETEIEKLGAKPLLELIQNSPVTLGSGSWPLLDKSWKPGSFDLEQILARMRWFYGVDTLISSGISADERNTSVNVLHLDQAALSFGGQSEDYYTKPENEKIRIAYQKLIADVLNEVAKDGQLSLVGAADTIASDIVQFEVSLAQANSPASERRNVELMYNRMTVKTLMKEIPGIDWTSYIARLLTLSPAEAETTTVVVFEMDYMRKLSEILKTANKATVANYLLWRLIYSRLQLFNEKYRKLDDQFSTVLRGPSKLPRWHKCMNFVIGQIGEEGESLGYAAGLMYVQDHFPKEAKSELLQMTANLIDSFNENILTKATWMDGESKEEGFRKVKTLRENRFVGYPDFYETEGAMDTYYEDLKIAQADGFFELCEKINEWSIEKEFKKIDQPVDRSVFGGSPAIVNAWYDPSKNSISFPAAIVQPPFFAVDSPKAVNYGAMGSVIGHEITHGFDDMGSQFDSNGNLRNWWSKASAENFAQSKQCIVDQYSSFKYQFNATDEIYVSGNNTQGENIADNGGLRESFLAYQAFVKQKYPAALEEPRLPGLQHLSMNRVFFISYGLFECGAYTDSALKFQLQTNEHAPGRDRVIGTMQNSREFAEAFQCAAGSRMNPEKKCHVW